MIKGIIFDVDGTLLDSMHIWGELGKRHLSFVGIKAKPGLAKILFPMSLDESSEYLKMDLDFRDLICNISGPTLVVYGEKDRANKSASIELADILNDAELYVLNGTGHEANIEAPERLARKLREFYDSV